MKEKVNHKRKSKGPHIPYGRRSKINNIPSKYLEHAAPIINANARINPDTDAKRTSGSIPRTDNTIQYKIK